MATARIERAALLSFLAHFVGDVCAWDFRPPFKTSPRPDFNVRLESVHTLGVWKRSFASKRCIVPMSGYVEFENRIEKGKEVKYPHYLHGPRPLLAAAGIYTGRKVDGGGETSAAIITQEATDASGNVHPRMPVFLTPDLYGDWLSPAELTTDEEKEEVLATLKRVGAEVAQTITGYVIDRRFNNSRAIDPSDRTLIESMEV